VLDLGVAIPALDAERTLPATLESLRDARRQGAEVVLIDGGSTDRTPAIAAAAGIRVITAPGGMYAALNAGFRSLQSSWLTWINADDLVYADGYASRLRSMTDADVLYGSVDFIDLVGRFVHSWTSGHPADLLPLYRAGYSPLLQQGTLFRRSVFETLGGFDESYRYVGDADFWWRSLEASFVFRRDAPPPVAAFRLHGAQLSQKFAGEMIAEHARMVAAHGGSRWSPRSWLGLARFRGRNFPAYVVRYLRRGDLEGRARLAGSYDLVRRTK
jgi:glycosyltransferase involved in cell wall biosynthesis